MSTEALLFYFCIFFVFLAIGIVATKLNNPILLAAMAGLMIGGLLGLFFAMFWAAWTGNLMMGEHEYERQKAVQTTWILIIGCTALIGALIGLVRSLLRTQRGTKSHEGNAN